MASRTPTENQPTAPGDSLGSGRIANAPANEPGPSAPPERERRQLANGLRFLGVGAALIVIGLVLLPILGDGNRDGIAATIAIIGALPAIVGAVLVGASIVSRRSRQGKSFA